jgi:aspartyl-tRNA(Asn)/glutamyl-tRNA(Gln) amidotransferase subunit C
MAISRDEIIHIAKLSDLNLSEEEIERYKTDLNDILEFATIINNVDTSDVDITIGANAKSNCFRKDEVVNFPNTDLLLKNAPSQDEGMFHIPKVIN